MSALTLQPGTDYVTDVQWSPSHPTVLGATDASGGLYFYDVLRDTDRPLASFSPTGAGLTSIRFSPSGSVVVAGDVTGGVAVARLPDELGVPRGDEIQRLQTLHAEALAAATGVMAGSSR